MILKRPELCMVVPHGAEPRDWPQGWTFPPPVSPPGWPRKQTPAVLSIAFSFDGATLKCLNEFGDVDKALDGEMILITAAAATKPIRVRMNVEHYSVAILALIENGRVDLSTLQAERKFAGADPIKISAQLFGYDREPLTWQA